MIFNLFIPSSKQSLCYPIGYSSKKGAMIAPFPNENSQNTIITIAWWLGNPHLILVQQATDGKEIFFQKKTHNIHVSTTFQADIIHYINAKSFS